MDISNRKEDSRKEREFRNGRIPDHVLNEEPPEFFLVENHYDGAKIRYKINDPRIKFHDIVSLFEYLRPQILRLIEAHPNTKVGLNVHTLMVRRTTGAVERKGLFTGRMFENFRGTNPESVFNALREIIYERLQKLEDVVGSGLMLLSIEYFTITFCEIRVAVGSSYKPLPPEIVNFNGAVDNVDNNRGNDQQCFNWAITRAVFPVARKPKLGGNVVTAKLRKQAENLNWDGISFPTALYEIDIFENLHKISVMMLGWDEEGKLVTYLRKPGAKYEKAIQIFYHENHYSAVKKMSALMYRTMGNHTYYFCPYCSFHHRKEEAVKEYMKDCTAEVLTNVKMPKEEEFVEFKDWHHVLFKPFVIYADKEGRLEKTDVKKGKNTTQTQVHRSAGYCYHLVSRVDPSESCTVQYTAKTNDEDISTHFIKSVDRLVKEIGEKHAGSKSMVITEEEQASFDAATTCWVCGGKTVDDGLGKVRDYCHFTGKYRGAAHNECNLKLKRDKTIPVVFHNGTRYDFHLFVRSLGRVEGHIKTIAKNSEQYISIDKSVYVSEGNTWRVRFMDFYGFIQASLENLVENLLRENLKY